MTDPYMPVINFTTNDAGSTVGTAVCATNTPLVAGSQLSINGSTDLSAIIVGNSGALVNSITMQDDGEFFTYELSVTGQGPAGAGSGSLELGLLDQAGGTHWLKLDSSTNKTHTLGYNSSSPDVVSISWAPGRE